jgi:hypothetical protein
MNSSEITQQAQALLRNGENFQWYVIPLLAAVVYAYANEFTKKNYKGIAAGLALYGVHWFFEILNALIKHFSGNALWTVPTGTSYLLLIGVGIELSLMFSVAGLIMSKFLPANPKQKVLGLNNRGVFCYFERGRVCHHRDLSGHHAGFLLVLQLVGRHPRVRHRVHPFFLAAFLCHDWQPKVQKRFLAIVWGIDVLAMVVFAGILSWI